jgi:regulator of sirC expression with transglutaminase-like and TPR domain
MVLREEEQRSYSERIKSIKQVLFSYLSEFYQVFEFLENSSSPQELDPKEQERVQNIVEIVKLILKEIVFLVQQSENLEAFKANIYRYKIIQPSEKTSTDPYIYFNSSIYHNKNEVLFKLATNLLYYVL